MHRTILPYMVGVYAPYDSAKLSFKVSLAVSTAELFIIPFLLLDVQLSMWLGALGAAALGVRALARRRKGKDAEVRVVGGVLYP